MLTLDVPLPERWQLSACALEKALEVLALTRGSVDPTDRQVLSAVLFSLIPEPTRSIGLLTFCML
jgi:hypothetical protein